MPQSRSQQQVIDEFRLQGGKVGGYFAGLPLLLLTTTGARTRQPRTTPLTYMTDGPRYVVCAADAGSSRNPDWYYNLLADPDVTVEVGVEKFNATATVVIGNEREALFARFVAEQPQTAAYQARTTRPIPMVVLRRA